MERVETEKPYCHFSIDDVVDINEDLSDGKRYQSVFEQPLLKQLKEWHDKYGVKVSLYIMDNFKISKAYAGELQQNSDWLRLGYHAFGATSSKKGVEDFYKTMRDSLGPDCKPSKTVRVDYYHADANTCLEYSEAGSAEVFLTADDWGWNREHRETNYYLSAAQSDSIELRDRLRDTENGLVFVKTDLRAEHIKKRFGNASRASDQFLSSDPDREFIFFTHENVIPDHIGEIDTVFRKVVEAGWEFDYPENRKTVRAAAAPR